MSTDNKKQMEIKAREATGQILFSVISGALTPLEATKYFPKNSEDISIKIAWHALLHYDADEEIRLKDADYAQEQIKYIELIAKILLQGNELPQNMLKDYEDLYIDTVMPKRYDFFGKLKAFFRFINFFGNLVI